MGYLCIPTSNLAGVKDWAGSWLCSRERKELQGKRGGTRIVCSSAVPSLPEHVACFCKCLGASAHTALLRQRQQVPGESEWPSWGEEGPYCCSRSPCTVLSTTKHDQSVEPTGSFCVAFNTSLLPLCPCLCPTTG